MVTETAKKSRKKHETSLVKAGSTEVKSYNAPVGYATAYANQNGIILDGKAILRNNRTYSIMYRINTDIRRCIIEITNTTMKS